MKFMFFLLIILGSSMPSFARDTRALNVTGKIAEIYQRSLTAAGKASQMDKRALVLYHLYIDSQKEFTFALSVSHLTLAIERSASAPRFTNILDLLQMQETANGWTLWGEGLKKINQLMVQRLHFAYYLYKEVIADGTSYQEINQLQLSTEQRHFLNDTATLYPFFEEIQAGNISSNRKQELAEEFANWEHRIIIQPKMEVLYSQMPSLIKFMVRNVPGTGVEFFLKGLQIRTTLGLKCLAPFKNFRTKDFMDADIRVNQAVMFHQHLASNDFDPQNTCFQDPYYVTHFPRRFHGNPAEFANWYYHFITQTEFQNQEERWLQQAYKDLPVIEMATLPSRKIKIMSFYQDQLRMEENALTRNHSINQHYSYLADSLMKCMGFDDKQPFANWYHYAFWASKSARKVISGDFFLQQDIALKIGMNFASFFGLFQKPVMQGIFARTNNLIALEMIPLGQEFFHTFCIDKEQDFNNFGNKLLTETGHDKLLYHAFYQYYLAIHERNLKLKKERIAYATTLQVMSEQIRVDDNIKESFFYNGYIPLAEYIFHNMATQAGSLQIGSPSRRDQSQLLLRTGRSNGGRYSRNIDDIFNGDQMHLSYDVRTALTDRDLLDINLEEYRNLLSRYGLAVNVRKIHKYKKTGVQNWANLPARLKHLIAQFRTNMTNPKVFEMEGQ